MLIRKISIENFQSYYSCNDMEFSKGLNLIIGNGGKGKSKLFNAFYWALFGKIYITDVGWVDTDLLSANSKTNMGKHEYINMRALNKTPHNETVRVSVIIELTNKTNGREIDYIIERNALAKRLNHNSWKQESDWSVTLNELKVSFDSVTGTIVKEREYAKLEIDDLFPDGIRDYIWFQGESLDSLINFRKKETLKAAVKHISYYPLYEKLSQIISISTDKIEKAERNKTRSQNKNNSEVQTLVSTIELSNVRLDKAYKEKNDLENDILELESILQKDEKKLEGLADFTKVVNDYNQCEIDLNTVKEEIDKLDSYQRKELPQTWIMRGIDTLIEQSKDIISTYTSKQDSIPERKYLENPGRTKLEEILSNKQCYVCGQDVLSDSDPYNTILRRIQEQEQYFKEFEEYTNNLSVNKKFERFIGSISDYPDSILFKLQLIDKNYQKSEGDIIKLIQKRKLVEERKAKLDERIADIKNKYHVDVKREAGSANTITSGLRATRGNIERLKRKLDVTIKDIMTYESEIKKCQKELDKFSNTVSGTRIPETEWKNISEFLKDVCRKVQEKARKELLIKIQIRANEFYEKFTQHDNGYKGSIVIDEDYSIAFDPGLNTSHEDRKKMSIINALLSLNQEALDIYYPFISDAPTSNFDNQTTQSYLLGVKDMFEQSIIMTKDVDMDKVHFQDLKLDANVSKIYLLESKFFEETKFNPEIFEVATKISLIK
jgi:DNA sulfur modification protein DndD